MTAKVYLTVPQLSKRWQVPAGTLYYWKHVGRGPACTKIGRGLRYELADVEKYESAHFIAGERI